MNERSDPRLVNRLSIFASAAGIVPGLIGLSVLGGWTFHVVALLTWGAATPMAPNAAGCTILASVSLCLLRRQDSQSFSVPKRLAAKTAAGIITLVGLLSLAEHLFDLNFGIDRLLLLTPLNPQTVAARILMSPVAAGFFLLLGPALWVIDWRTRRGDWPAQFLTIGAMTGAAFGLFGLILGPGISPITVALPAVVSYFLLTSGLLCSRPTWFIGGLLVRESPGASLLRKAVPAALLILSVIGLSISNALLTESHFTWIEVSLLALISSALLGGFIIWMAFLVERGDAQREKMEVALHAGKEQLDRLLDRIEEPQEERLLRRKVNAGFAVAVLLTILLGALSWRTSRQAAEDADWVAHTHEVSATLELILRHLDDIETGGRGFALTGNEPFLEPYEKGKNAVRQDLQALHLLTVDNPDQQRQLDILAQQASARIEAAGDLVALRRTSGAPPTVAQLERGKQVMDEARVTVEKMEAEENRLLEERTQRARGAQRFNSSAIGLGLVLGIVFLSVAGMTVSREIGVSARARAQVNALNVNLEWRVKQRTAALESEAAARIASDAKLRASQGRLAGIIASAMDSIITVDDQQRIVLFHGAAEKMFRCPEAEAMGQPITRFIPKRFHASHAEHIQRFGETGITNRAMGPKDVLWAQRADGQEFQIEASISQVVTGGKKLFTVILRDVTERKRSEEIRERLASVVDSSDDAIIAKTLDGIITSWNRGAEKVFGYLESEAVGKPMLMLMPPERVKEEPDILARMRQGQSVEHFETVRVRKDGKKIDVSVTISPIRDGSGAIIGASKIARDITERKRAEEALRDSEEKLRLALEGARLGTWHWKINTDELEGSPRSFAVFGLPADTKFNVARFIATLHPDDRIRVQEAMSRSLTGESEYDIEYRTIWPDGTERWIAAKGHVYKNAHGENTHMGGILFDVTERKRSEAELLRQAEELYRSRQALETQTLMLQSVLDSIDEGLVAADENGKFILWNAAATRIVGMGAENVPPGEWNSHYGVYLPDTITPLPDEQNPLSRAIRGEVSTAEIFLRNPELEEGVWLEIGGGPLKGRDGSARGGVVAFRDITQKKAAELEIRKLNEDLEERIAQRTAQLEAANHELEAFTYSVSHDLRAPIRHISSFAKILSEDFGSTMDPEARRHLERIQNGARRMALLVDGLLSLARLGAQSLKLSLIDLNALVDEAISVLRTECEGRDVEWRVTKLPALKCDPILMGQVFQNLIGNALKYSGRRAKAIIEIGSIQQEGKPTVIFVRDNGAGFSMQYASKLFGVFQRMHQDSEFEGTGVGLATVHRIIQKHGGSIWAEAEVDHGATFYFTMGEKAPIETPQNSTANGTLEHVHE